MNATTLIEWQDEFNIGIEEVDFEHRELINLINESYAEAIKEGSTNTVMDYLGEIHATISAHFALEEKVMRDMQYDQYEDHEDDHKRLLGIFRDIMENVSEIDQQTFGNQLKEWFVEHFSTKDARMHKFLNH